MEGFKIYDYEANISELKKMEQLSGVMIIIIIGGGVLIFVMFALFAKRQIMRFTLRSRRGPHVPVGNDAKKSIRREIERRLDCIQRIAYEPKLIWDDDIYDANKPENPLPPYYYRMQAVDDIKILEKEITKNDGSVRHPNDSLRAYLLTTLAPLLNGAGQRMIHQFMDMYEHARHDPNEFGRDEYDAYHRLLMKLIDAAKMLKSFSSSRKTSPSRTPVKKQQLTKMHSLLDPSRLRPPPLTTGIGFSTPVTPLPIRETPPIINNTINDDDDNKNDNDDDIQMIDDATNNEKNVSQTNLGLHEVEINEVRIEDISDDENEIISISQYSGNSRI